MSAVLSNRKMMRVRDMLRFKQTQVNFYVIFLYIFFSFYVGLYMLFLGY